MNSETEIVLSLLRSIKNQMQVGNSAESSLTYQHPNFGELVFEMDSKPSNNWGNKILPPSLFK